MVLAAAAVLTAVLVQLTVVNPLELPGGGPDLVLLTVVGLAIVQGQVAGAVLGFLAGLLLDVVPPADTLVGLWALVLCLVGVASGRLGPMVRGSAVRTVGFVAAASAGAVVMFATIALLFGGITAEASVVASVALASAGYDVLLSPFVVPALVRLASRAEPDLQRL